MVAISEADEKRPVIVASSNLKRKDPPTDDTDRPMKRTRTLVELDLEVDYSFGIGYIPPLDVTSSDFLI